jgi:hypothetical protein
MKYTKRRLNDFNVQGSPASLASPPGENIHTRTCNVHKQPVQTPGV